MKKAIHIITLLLTLALASAAAAQEIVMVNNDTVFLVPCGGGIAFYDDGGSTGNYTNRFDGWAVMNVNPGESITLTGNYEVESNYDYINIYDNATQVAHYTGAGTANVTVTSGVMRVYFHSDMSVVRSGFAFMVTSDHQPVPCTANISGLTVSRITSTTAFVQWTSDSDSLRLDYGDSIIDVSGDTVTLTGLDTNTEYQLRLYHPSDSGELCCTRTAHFTTSIGAGHGCIDPTNLTAGYVLAYTGSFDNPYASTGIIDNGPLNAGSRHTIHTDPNERDPRTGNMLRTVPSGATSSVRLGNWQTNSEAEALLYAIEVDTTENDLLLLRYAAVLQDPNHNASEQPRFRLELLNTSMELIDPTCGAVDFIANSSLGWNNNSGTLWKDWTSVGIDLTPYAGQTIYVRLTTYDCSQGAHYGYAYFTLECAQKRLETESCGAVDTISFTAPDGFNYLWYSNSPMFPASMARTFTINSSMNTTYYCTLSYIDNSTCHFTMSAFAGTRYPLSLFDSTVTVSNCEFDVSFFNHSTISSDGINPVGTDERCETAWWDFGNGQTSTEFNPTMHYSAPGDYVVTLVSGITNNACTDTLRKTLHLYTDALTPTLTGPAMRCDGAPADTLIVSHAATSTWLSDTLLVAPDSTTTYYLSVTDSDGCSYNLEHTITVYPSYDSSLSVRICDDTLYNFEGDDLNSSGTYTHRVFSEMGCDSVITLHLVVKRTPTAAFTYEPELQVIHDAHVQLINNSAPDTISFLWEFEREPGGSVDTSSEFEPTYTWNTNDLLAPGDYRITLTAIWTHSFDDTTLSCVDSTSQTVAIVNDFLQFPNLVTPNGDGNNDTWRVVNMLECGIYTINELWVFNKWGTEIYHVRDISREEDFWDPNRTNSPDGTYYYRFSTRSPFGVIQRSGTIEVLRGQ